MNDVVANVAGFDPGRKNRASLLVWYHRSRRVGFFDRLRKTCVGRCAVPVCVGSGV